MSDIQPAEKMVSYRPFTERITRDDAAIGRIMQDILDATAELEQDASFCGYVMEIQRDHNEAIVMIRLIPHDDLGGIAAPRSA